MCPPLHCITSSERRRQILRSKNACCHTVAIAVLFLHRLETSAVINFLLKFWSVSANSTVYRIHRVIWWPHVRLNKVDTFTLMLHSASGGVRQCAVLLQRPLVTAASCTDIFSRPDTGQKPSHMGVNAFQTLGVLPFPFPSLFPSLLIPGASPEKAMTHPLPSLPFPLRSPFLPPFPSHQ